MKALGPWPSMDKASAFYYSKKEKAEDPGFKSPRVRHLWTNQLNPLENVVRAHS
jgi:hypothetical protein